jgi:formate/nitrite transporter FocA (FNT family)
MLFDVVSGGSKLEPHGARGVCLRHGYSSVTRQSCRSAATLSRVVAQRAATHAHGLLTLSLSRIKACMAKIERFPGGPQDQPSQPEREQRESEKSEKPEAAEVLSDMTTRRTAHEIFTNVEKNAHDELKRTTRALAFSGLAGGFGMGLTGLGVAAAQARLGDGNWQEFISLLFYPLGFISVIIGRSQLFTENTLYPVALILSERKHVFDTARLWITVFIANIAGAAVFAALMVRTSSLRSEVAQHLVTLGQNAVTGQYSHIFWSGVVGGWIIALMAWIVTASHWTIGQVVIVWALTVVVGMGHFAHCIASTGEILSAVFSGHVGLSHYIAWLGAATSGNICGGVTFVTLLNFGQVTDEKEKAESNNGHEE